MRIAPAREDGAFWESVLFFDAREFGFVFILGGGFGDWCGMFFVVDEACDDASDDAGEDGGQAGPVGEVQGFVVGIKNPVVACVSCGDEKFYADKDEDDEDGVFEHGESFDDAGQDEIEGAETKDGEDVGGEDDEGVGGDAKDGGDGIDGEDDVGDFDDDECDEERGHEKFAVDALEEVHAFDFSGVTEVFHQEFGDPFVLGIGVVIAAEGGVDGEIDEEDTEDPEYPVEAGDECGAQGDHDASEDEGAQDAPEQDAVLEFEWNAERGKDHGHDGDVVEREGFFDEISGEIIHDGGGTVFVGPFVQSNAAPVGFVHEINGDTEEQGQANPEHCPFEGFGGVNDMHFSVEHTEIERQQTKDEHEKRDPWDQGHKTSRNVMVK